jgi:membrane glycosyltransferase
VTESFTAPVVAAGLIGGFAAARYSGRRELGGVVLAAAGAWCTTEWFKAKGPVVAGSLLGGYLVAFGASHPLAKKIGAWPAVFAVTTAAAGAAYAVADH